VRKGVKTPGVGGGEQVGQSRRRMIRGKGGWFEEEPVGLGGWWWRGGR